MRGSLEPHTLTRVSSKRDNIYLVGPMGSGKTAVGRDLARALELPFFDSDAEIERRTGVDIAYIFEREGEAGFRRREQDVIRDLTAQSSIVLATGGGVVLDEHNRERLRSTGTVVYLETSVDEQLKRTRRSSARPLLKAENPRATLEKLLGEREALYEGLADIRVDTTGRRVGAVASAIRKRLRDPESGASQG